MTEQFDFDKIGKKVPYRIPDGFFDDMQQQVLKRTEEPRRRRTMITRISSVIIGMAAVVSAFVFIPRVVTTSPDAQESAITEASMFSWIEELSDEDLQAMDDITDYDIFMN